jgi:hypothetical protein
MFVSRSVSTSSGPVRTLDLSSCRYAVFIMAEMGNQKRAWTLASASASDIPIGRMGLPALSDDRRSSKDARSEAQKR